MKHRQRIIPLLLLGERGLVKSRAFAEHRYVGDPLNAARLFSELAADELIVLDITASAKGRSISPEFVTRIADEITMPLSAGGGVTSLESVTSIIAAGAEKVVLSTGAWRDPYLIKDAADRHGSSAVCVCIDVKKNAAGDKTVHVSNGRQDTGFSPVEFAMLVEEHGAGEIIIQSIEKDGSREGYDLELTSKVARAVRIPVVGLGGAGEPADLNTVVSDAYASAAAAGSMFVFHGSLGGVLINYPQRAEVHDC